jgi:hypothetical protein
MPTNRKRTRRPSQAQPWISQYLLYGFDEEGPRRALLWYPEFGGNGGCLAGNEREPWEAARAELLPAWIKEHPGTRPFAWWRIDAPGFRRDGESELETLVRHNLLTDHERRLLL